MKSLAGQEMVGGADTGGHLVPTDVMDYLASRFVLSSLNSKRGDCAPFWGAHWSDVSDGWTQVCSKMERAYWHYFDECLTEKEKVGLGDSEDPEKNFPFVKFCSQLFLRVPVLHPHLSSLKEILNMFRKWKGALPAYGVILLNPALNKVLLVQEFGYKKRWGFPKGTLEAGESREECAAREAFEEVGVDVAQMIDNREWFKRKIGTKVRTLFVIPNPVAPHGISEATVFGPKGKGEIGDIKWFSLKGSFSGNDFFTVKPFIEDIRRWVLGFGQDQTALIKAWQKRQRIANVATERGEAEEQEAPAVTKLQWKDSGVEIAEEDAGSDDGVVVGDEQFLDVVGGERGDSCVVGGEEEIRDELLPPGFLPKAWNYFHLDHHLLLQIATGEIELAMEQHRIAEKPKSRLRLRG